MVDLIEALLLEDLLQLSREPYIGTGVVPAFVVEEIKGMHLMPSRI